MTVSPIIQQITEPSEIFSIQTRIKKEHGKLVTNLYESTEWIEKQIKKKSLFKIDKIHSCFILNKHNDVFYLYFFTADAESLKSGLEALNNLHSGSAICEILDKSGSSKDVIDALFANGYNRYGELVRLNKKILPDDIAGGSHAGIVYACEADADAILYLQKRVFNKYIDKHLSYEDFIEYIKNRNILIMKSEGGLCGFVLFSVKNFRAHLRYIVVDKSVAHKGTGNMLLKALYCELGVGKLLEVWSRKDNEIVWNMYKKKGFLEDGLTDIVLYKSDGVQVIEPVIPLN